MLPHKAASGDFFTHIFKCFLISPASAYILSPLQQKKKKKDNPMSRRYAQSLQNPLQ